MKPNYKKAYNILMDWFNFIPEEDKNPAHFCFNNCGKFLGHRGWCSQKCHDGYWDSFLESVKHYTKK